MGIVKKGSCNLFVIFMFMKFLMMLEDGWDIFFFEYDL